MIRPLTLCDQSSIWAMRGALLTFITIMEFFDPQGSDLQIHSHRGRDLRTSMAVENRMHLGADWTVARIRWTDWNRQHADGRGYYMACQGAGGPCDNFWAMIRVTQVREHHGARYFANMKITGRHHRVEWLVMNTQQGCWRQRATPR